MQHPDFPRELAPWTERILLGGFEPFSTVDWPGKLAATIFLRGCPWRCVYCHNPHLQKRSRDPLLGWPPIAAELAARQGWLDGVVFSGGEPTADSTLPEAIAAVKALGFQVGLHTGGAYPERLAAVLPLLDWVGFDLKTDYAGYAALTGAPGSGARATRSARQIVASGVAHEFRLTWHHQVLSEEAAALAAHFAKELGARRFVLQQYRTEGVAAGDTLDPHSPIPVTLFEQVSALFEDFEVRGEICGLAGEIIFPANQG
jgi:pyruvate formate lyase activating enzyme